LRNVTYLGMNEPETCSLVAFNGCTDLKICATESYELETFCGQPLSESCNVPQSSSEIYYSSFSSEVPTQPSTITESSTGKNDGLGAGAIAGIVVCVVAFVCIVGVAIYCFVTSRPKYGVVDSAIYESDEESISMSVL